MHHCAIANFDHPSHPVFAKSRWTPIFSVKEVFDYNNFLNESIQIEFHDSLLWSSGRKTFILSKSK